MKEEDLIEECLYTQASDVEECDLSIFDYDFKRVEEKTNLKNQIKIENQTKLKEEDLEENNDFALGA